MVLLYELLQADPRYTVDAYLLLGNGLHHVYQQTGGKTNITVLQLLNAISTIATERYGLLAETVLASWGIITPADILQLLTRLIHAGLLPVDTVDFNEELPAEFNFNSKLDISNPLPRNWSNGLILDS
ncbi:MAG: Minf_1886 family protein [candidate division WOR-3 bacterium]